jgi:hypothetical protein
MCGTSTSTSSALTCCGTWGYWKPDPEPPIRGWQQAHRVGRDCGLYQINGYIIFAEDGQIVGLVVDVAEGLLDVPFFASVLKDWTKPVPIPDEWIDAADDPVNPVSSSKKKSEH